MRYFKAWNALVLAFSSLYPNVAHAQFVQIIDVPPFAGVVNTIRAGTQVNLRNGGALQESFSVWGGELNVYGGTVGNHLDVAFGGVTSIYGGVIGNSVEVDSNSVMNIFGGSIGPSFDAFFGGVVNIYGGTIGIGFRAYGGIVTMSGGSIGRRIDIENGGVLTLIGGTLGEGLEIHPFSTFSIHGGTFGQGTGSFEGLDVYADAKLNIFGRKLLLDGEPISGLVAGQSIVIDRRDVTVSGILADSTSFSYRLLSPGIYVDPGATVTLTLVPEPTGLLLATFAVVAIRIRRSDLFTRG